MGTFSSPCAVQALIYSLVRLISFLTHLLFPSLSASSVDEPLSFVVDSFSVLGVIEDFIRALERTVLEGTKKTSTIFNYPFSLLTRILYIPADTCFTVSPFFKAPRIKGVTRERKTPKSEPAHAKNRQFKSKQ